MNQNLTLNIYVLFCLGISHKIQYYTWVELPFRKWRKNRKLIIVVKNGKFDIVADANNIRIDPLLSILL